MSDTKTKIIEKARKLFANHGYDGVSTRMLASEVGISVSTLNYHIGSKADLYIEIFKEAFIEESQLVFDFCESVEPHHLEDPIAFRDLLLKFVNDYTEQMASYPEAAQLWLRRWLAAPDSQIAQMDVDFGTHLYRAIRNVIRDGQEAGLLSNHFNMRYFLMGFTWQQYGFFSGGTSFSKDPDAPKSEPDAPSIEQFKQHMGLYVCNMLGLPLPAELGQPRKAN